VVAVLKYSKQNAEIVVSAFYLTKDVKAEGSNFFKKADLIL